MKIYFLKRLKKLCIQIFPIIQEQPKGFKKIKRTHTTRLGALLAR